MRKEELSQLFWLNREVEEQQRRLEELESLSTSCTTQLTGMPRGSGISDKVARYATEIADLRAAIDRNIARCFRELSRLNRFIQEIDESQMRMILSLRYINGLSWQQIAFSIGEYDEQYPRKKHNEFLKKYPFEEVEDPERS